MGLSWIAGNLLTDCRSSIDYLAAVLVLLNSIVLLMEPLGQSTGRASWPKEIDHAEGALVHRINLGITKVFEEK